MALFLLSYIRVEPLTRIERVPSPYEGDALPGELQRHRLPDKDSNLDHVVQGHASSRLDDPALVREARVERAGREV